MTFEFCHNFEERYWSHVDKHGPDECWPWTASSAGPQDHGRLWVGNDGDRKVFWYAHRVAWLLATGEHPGSAKVRHKCDYPPCQNPTHLILGTQADNIADMIARGRDRKRGRPGEAHHNSKLTIEQVREIRRRVAAGEMQKVLAAEMGVRHSQISRIISGTRWSKVS